MKGADVAMASIVQYNDWLEEEVKALAVLQICTTKWGDLRNSTEQEGQENYYSDLEVFTHWFPSL